jgi:hypothetical protein
MAGLLDPDNVARITPPSAGLLGDQSQVSQGSALANLYQQVSDEIARQQQISADRGLWADGGPTAAGVVDAAQQYGSGLLMGSTAPGIRAFHGSPADFERFDANYLHPDEAGHYFTPDEALARDYAGRPSATATAPGHMYEVNINADPAEFLDYGALTPADRAALNDPGAVQNLRDAGVPGIRMPDRSMVVFNDATIAILRKYGIAGLGLGGLGAATQQGNGR